MSTDAIVRRVTPQKSPVDNRQFRVIVLKNGLKACLVSDPDTDMSGAAMDTSVGQLQDPADLLGLAHFLEHMLFMGTKRYPDEAEYTNYLTKNKGSCNAYTALDTTNYQFEVLNHAFEGALDRFAQFFIEPLFHASSTDRELNAVHSEHQKNINSDVWRIYEVGKKTAAKGHPLRQFGTGNLETLRDRPAKLGLDLRKELLSFHEKYYSSHVLTLAVISNISLDELERLVVKYCSDIKLSENQFSTSAFVKQNMLHDPRNRADECHPLSLLTQPVADKDSVGILHKIIPVKDMHSLNIEFPLPPCYKDYKSGPLSLLSHIVGYEGKGSLLSFLKAQGYATALSASPASSYITFSFFEVDVTLTEKGAKNIKAVTQCVFAYLSLIVKASDDELARLARENADLTKMEFTFKAKENPFSFATHLSRSLKQYEEVDVLIGGRVADEINIPRVRDFLNKMTPENARLTFVSPFNKAPTGDVKDGEDLSNVNGDDVKVDQTDYFYGTQYGVGKFTEDFMTSFNQAYADPNALIKSIETNRKEQTKDASSEAKDGETSGLGESDAGDSVTMTLPDPNPFISSDFTLFTSETGATSPVEEQKVSPAVPASEMHPLVKQAYDALGAKNMQSLSEPELIEVNAEALDQAKPTSPTSSRPLPLVDCAPLVRVFYKLDRVHRLPKYNFLALIRSTHHSSSPTFHATNLLYMNIVDDSMAEISYQASLAGLSINFSQNGQSLVLQASGMSEKLDVLIALAHQHLINPRLTPSIFARLKEKYTRGVKSMLFAQPISQANELLHASVGNGVTSQEILQVLPTITMEDIKTHISLLFRSISIDCLAHGNVTRDKALRIATDFYRALKSTVPPISRYLAPRPPVAKLPRGHTFVFVNPVYNQTEPNSATFNYYQCGRASLQQSALLEILSTVSDDLSFDRLRTIEQLGYMAYSRAVQISDVNGFAVLVQSLRPGAYLDGRIEHYIDKILIPKLESLTEEEFTELKSSLVKSYISKDTSLHDETRRYWGAIALRTYHFRRAELVAQNVANATKEDAVRFAKEYLSSSSSKRAKTSIQFNAQKVDFALDKSSYRYLSPLEMRDMDLETLHKESPLEDGSGAKDDKGEYKAHPRATSVTLALSTLALPPELNKDALTVVTGPQILRVKEELETFPTKVVPLDEQSKRSAFLP